MIMKKIRDFLYGIFDEEEQINDKLILFAKSYIPGKTILDTTKEP